MTVRAFRANHLSGMEMRKGEREFEEAIETHRRLLEGVCRLYARDPDDREDLAGEIVLQLWRAYPRFDPQMRFSTWMARVALNVAISHVRRETRRVRGVGEDERMLEVAADAPSEEARALYGMVAALDPLNRALMLLHLEGHTHAEVGEVLGLSATNVATKIGRIKETMKEKNRE